MGRITFKRFGEKLVEEKENSRVFQTETHRKVKVEKSYREDGKN